jgi:hypothetical protein
VVPVRKMRKKIWVNTNNKTCIEYLSSPVHECAETSCGKVEMVRYAAWHIKCVGEPLDTSYPLTNCCLL